jgi:phytoene dehydrogenase-like protein
VGPLTTSSTFPPTSDTGRLPSQPFLLIGQTTKSDPTRSPAGAEAVWAYAHLPRGLRTTSRRASWPAGWNAPSNGMPLASPT